MGSFATMVKNIHNIPIDVSCAIIVRDGKILVARRSNKMEQAGLWEFPGGKVDAHESAADGLIREIKEELSVNIQITGSLTPIIHHYKNKTIRLIPFIATIADETPIAIEHERVEWFLPADLENLNWSPADIPILKEFLNERRKNHHRI